MSLLLDARFNLILLLVVLPPASSYSGLEELRAAHNLISQVPASLSKNAALRTLDLGHNRIDKWVGLERLGKSLKSLMQLSLAGNPLCGPSTAAASEDKEEEGEGEGEVEGEYVAKIRSLFPGLKVRDGKRILMKKSHTYYETRGADEGGGVAKDAPGPGGRGKPSHPAAAIGGRTGLGAMSEGEGTGRRKVEEGEKKGGKSPKSKGVRGGGGAKVVEEEEGAGEQESKAARKMKKKAARAAEAELAAEAERKAEVAALAKSGKQSAKKRRRDAKEGAERRSRSPVERKKKQKQRRPSDGAAADPVVESAAATDSTTAASKQKGSKTSKKKKTKHGHKGASTAGGNLGQQQEEDPYSSSEELPIPGRQATKSAPAVAVASVGGDRESGVVSVVINKKRKGAVGGTAQARQGGVEPGRAENGGKFSFDAILEARGEKESIGLGSGVSAWDT